MTMAQFQKLEAKVRDMRRYFKHFVRAEGGKRQKARLAPTCVLLEIESNRASCCPRANGCGRRALRPRAFPDPLTEREGPKKVSTTAKSF